MNRKMRILFLVITWIIIGLSTHAQSSIRTDFDTIQKYPDKTLVHYKTYRDSVLIEDSQAFLYPVILVSPRFCILKNIFKTEIIADSVVFHGQTTSYLANRYYKTESYNEGVLISTKYYNSSNQEISEEDYQIKNTIRGPCGVLGAQYLIQGEKED